MKKVIGIVGGLVIAASAAAADQPRLALWITEPIGATSGAQCNLNFSSQDRSKLPVAPPTLTERDVSAWHPQTARWTLDTKRFAGIESAQKLQDHCFVLAIDGKPVSSGMVLSEYSARLSGLSTMIVMNRRDAISLELLSSNHGTAMQHLHVEALGRILQQKAVTEK